MPITVAVWKSEWNAVDNLRIDDHDCHIYTIYIYDIYVDRCKESWRRCTKSAASALAWGETQVRGCCGDDDAEMCPPWCCSLRNPSQLIAPSNRKRWIWLRYTFSVLVCADFFQFQLHLLPFPVLLLLLLRRCCKQLAMTNTSVPIPTGRDCDCQR